MDLLVFTHLLNALGMIALGVGVGVYCTWRFKLPWGLYFIGSATFILSQVGHIPFNGWLGSLFQKGVLVLPAGTLGVLVNAVIAGLSAGLWEEGARYAMYRWWAKDARSWSKALTLGAGHGGIEAVILGLLALWAFFQAVALRHADLTEVLSGDQLGQAQNFLKVYWNFPWYETLLGAFERAFTIPLHLACSVLVLQAFRRGQVGWLGVAVIWHALADATVVFILSLTQNTYLVEGLVAIFGVVSLGIIWALRSPEPPQGSENPEEPVPPSAAIPQPVEESPESLEKSKYSS